MEHTLDAFRTALFGLAGAAAIGLAAQAAEISGAGATFPYPIYAKWAEAYAAKTGLIGRGRQRTRVRAGASSLSPLAKVSAGLQTGTHAVPPQQFSVR